MCCKVLKKFSCSNIILNVNRRIYSETLTWHIHSYPLDVFRTFTFQKAKSWWCVFLVFKQLLNDKTFVTGSEYRSFPAQPLASRPLKQVACFLALIYCSRAVQKVESAVEQRILLVFYGRCLHHSKCSNKYSVSCWLEVYISSMQEGTESWGWNTWRLGSSLELMMMLFPHEWLYAGNFWQHGCTKRSSSMNVIKFHILTRVLLVSISC